MYARIKNNWYWERPMEKINQDQFILSKIKRRKEQPFFDTLEPHNEIKIFCWKELKHF